eukprot:scaffold117273_cov18-Tisochrysis_lutea.AAC.1
MAVPEKIPHLQTQLAHASDTGSSRAKMICITESGMGTSEAASSSASLPSAAICAWEELASPGTPGDQAGLHIKRYLRPAPK